MNDLRIIDPSGCQPVSLAHGLSVCRTVTRTVSLSHGLSVWHTDCQFVAGTVSLSHGLSVCHTGGCAKTTQRIDVLFGNETPGDPRTLRRWDEVR